MFPFDVGFPAEYRLSASAGSVWTTLSLDHSRNRFKGMAVEADRAYDVLLNLDQPVSQLVTSDHLLVAAATNGSLADDNSQSRIDIMSFVIKDAYPSDTYVIWRLLRLNCPSCAAGACSEAMRSRVSIELFARSRDRSSRVISEHVGAHCLDETRSVAPGDTILYRNVRFEFSVV